MRNSLVAVRERHMWSSRWAEGRNRKTRSRTRRGVGIVRTLHAHGTITRVYLRYARFAKFISQTALWGRFAKVWSYTVASSQSIQLGDVTSVTHTHSLTDTIHAIHVAYSCNANFPLYTSLLSSGFQDIQVSVYVVQNLLLYGLICGTVQTVYTCSTSGQVQDSIQLFRVVGKIRNLNLPVATMAATSTYESEPTPDRQQAR